MSVDKSITHGYTTWHDTRDDRRYPAMPVHAHGAVVPMTQPIRKKKRLWTNVLANGRREEKFRETVTVLPGGTEEYRRGYDGIDWSKRDWPSAVNGAENGISSGPSWENGIESITRITVSDDMAAYKAEFSKLPVEDQRGLLGLRRVAEPLMVAAPKGRRK